MFRITEKKRTKTQRCGHRLLISHTLKNYYGGCNWEIHFVLLFTSHGEEFSEKFAKSVYERVILGVWRISFLPRLFSKIFCSQVKEVQPALSYNNFLSWRNFSEARSRIGRDFDERIFTILVTPYIVITIWLFLFLVP